MKGHIINKCYCVAVAFVTWLLWSVALSGQTVDLADAAGVNDGPYVSLTTSGVVVDYVCGGVWIRQELDARDTVSFAGCCDDSALTYRIPLGPPEVEPYLFDKVTKIFAVSDVHGEYEYLKTLLISAGVVDENLNWQFGDGHLVIVGDVFDRGAQVTETLWLIYGLEQEALGTGGRVNFVLGNHEIMPLQGDLRYIHAKYDHVIATLPDTSYKDLFGPSTVLGRWLRTKNIAIRVNDILFVHAGINPEIAGAGYSLGMINRLMREHVDVPRDSIKADERLSYFFRSFGPVWYRGLVNEYNSVRASSRDVDEILRCYGASAIVVGHSELDSISSFYDNRVFDIDIPVTELGGLHGLLWEGGRFYRVLSDGTRQSLK